MLCNTGGVKAQIPGPRRPNRSDSHRQIVDSFRKDFDLSHRPLRDVHLSTGPANGFKTSNQVKSEVCPHLVQILLVNVGLPPLEAAALRHVHVHGADVVLAVVMALPPQTAKAAERQTPRL